MKSSSSSRALLALCLGALGVVYGDIGTSPLYALKECFDGPHGVSPTPENVLGVLSLVAWAMTFVVTFKYLTFVMVADNRGEGGILALMALVGQHETKRPWRGVLLVLGLFGAAPLYGDGVITPAISVLVITGGEALYADMGHFGRRPIRLAWLAVAMPALLLNYLWANFVKIREGGWFPLAAAGLVFVLMSTWKRGREALAAQIQGAGLPLELFLPDLDQNPPHRVPGTAVFMTSNPGAVPPVLLHHLKHNKVLHERVLLVSVVNEEIPAVDDASRLTVKALGNGFHQVVGRYGFMETPNVPALLGALPPWAIPGPRIELAQMETTYYLGRETLLADGPSRMAVWRKRLFIVMARNARAASAFFGLPPNRVVEMGAQIQL